MTQDNRSVRSSVEELRRLVEAFVSGHDRSKEYVARIEGLLLSDFRGTDVFEALTQPVASYEPQGGEYLYDAAALVKVFEEVLAVDLR